MKPIVHYNHIAGAIEPLVGIGALVRPLDHYDCLEPFSTITNGQTALTSRVLHVTETGFETLNTNYVRLH